MQRHTRGRCATWLLAGLVAVAPGAWAHESTETPPTPAERLAGAVRFRTVSHEAGLDVERDTFLGLHAYLAESFPRTHATLTREVVNEYSLLYTWRGTDPGAQPFLLTSHLDVVPVPEDTRDQWEHAPFDGIIAEGFIWGRGTLDNKSGVLATLEAVEALITDGFTPRRTIYLAFGHDEEVRGPAGAAKITELLQARGVRCEFTLDEGMFVLTGMMPGVEGPVGLIGIAEKGSCTLELTAHAPGGHSSVPPPDSAIGRLARAIQRVEASPLPARLGDGPAAAMFDEVGPHMTFPLRAIIANRWLFNSLLIGRLEQSPVTNALIRTTTAVTIVRGGVKRNVLPGKATATVNFRLLPGDTVEGVVAHVRKAIADPEIDIAVVAGREASAVSDHTAPAFERIRASVEAVMPDVVVVAPGLVVAGTDTKHYAKIADNSYRFLPMRLRGEDTSRFHGVNERIAETNYAEMIAFYTTLIRRSDG